MKKHFNIKMLCVLLFLALAACNAATFPPFLRSRYSLRWHQTTESATAKDEKNVTTPEAVLSTADIDATEITQILSTTTAATTTVTTTFAQAYDSHNNVDTTTEYITTTAKSNIIPTTPQTLLMVNTFLIPANNDNHSNNTRHRSSTIIPDYDYYGNAEAEESNNN